MILNSTEIVMGLHWDPPEGGIADAADLDALCFLFDAQDRLLEVVHPGHRQNANGSVLHTGDSTSGASVWDDERVFVFLDALPETVAALAFVIVSASRHALSDVRGAYCHLSDHVTDDVHVRVDLSVLESQEAASIATLHRRGTAWEVRAGGLASAGAHAHEAHEHARRLVPK